MKPARALPQPAALIATWFGCGFLPGAPGSWGSLAALPLAWIIVAGFGAGGLFIAALVLFALGCWPAAVTARALGQGDPGAIVVDEVVGQWLTLALGLSRATAPLAPLTYVAGFLLFRVFDVAKPWPVRWADREIGGGLGIMLDDVLAALYAGALLLIGRLILGY